MDTNTYFIELKKSRRFCPHCGFPTHLEQSYWKNSLYQTVCNYKRCKNYGKYVTEDRLSAVQKPNYDYRTGEQLVQDDYRTNVWMLLLASVV